MLLFEIVKCTSNFNFTIDTVRLIGYTVHVHEIRNTYTDPPHGRREHTMKRLSMNELHEMTMKAMQAWINECACEINRTMVMSWDHNNLFKGLHVVPDVLGYHAGRIIIEGFHFTSKARKADMIELVQWLHWAISGEYPAEETENTEEESENAETIEEEEHTMKKFYKVSFEHSAGIYCTNLAHAETIEDVERHYSKYAWQSVKEAQPWDVDEARMKGMPIIEIEHEKPAQDAAEAPETAEETETEEQTTEAQETATEAAEAASEAHTTEEKKEEENTMKNTNTATIENAVTLTDIIAPIKNEYAEDLLDYNGTTYICDAISEIADNRTSIYHSDILDFISRDPSALAEVVEEGLYEVRAGAGYNLYEHAQAAEYMRIEQDIYNQLDDAILAYAANYLRTAYHVEEIDAETWEAITDDLDDIDNNSRFDEITDIIDEHMAQDSEEEEA